MTNNERYAKLNKQLLKACFNKYTPATNTKRISKIASQMRYLESMPLKKYKNEG